MTRRLVASYLAIVLLVLLVLEVPLGLVFARSEREHLEDDLRHDALALALAVTDHLQGDQPIDLDLAVRTYAGQTGARVVVVDARGVRLADSTPREDASDVFANRPEIAAALRGKEAVGVRESRTLGHGLLFVAVPVASGGRVYGAVRLTYPTSVLDERIRTTWLYLLGFGLAVLALAGLVGLALARSLNRPLRELAGAAARLGSGDLAARAPEPADLPEVRVVAEVFNETAAKLGDLLEAQQEFVANASHQLRSPLAALQLRLENLEHDLSGRAASGDLRAALREVARLSRLVDGLLALARSDQPGPPREPVDAAAVAVERQQAWSPYAEERTVRVEVALPAGARLTAVATPGHLEQVLDNLLANALDVAPAGSAVTVGVRRDGDLVVVTVRDEGPGMPEEERRRAFDRFWRSPSARAGRAGGSGLGLAIVDRLVATDRGTVELLAAPGGGLEAVVRLPAAP